MHSPEHRDRIDIVLVQPRNPLNIGAAARAMANFGFSRLTVVAPYEPHWREAQSAVGATDLLQNARCVAHLSEAVADCTLVAGTGTLDYRRPEQRVVPLPEFPALAAGELSRSGRVALVFGSEKHGLTRDDLSLCHLLVEIPTDPRQPSMNLGQAVAVCLYELSRYSSSNVPVLHLSQTDFSSKKDADLTELMARSGALDLLSEVIEETMAAVGYSPNVMQRANRLNLRNLLRRLNFTEPDARRALRLFRRILWRTGRSDSTRERNSASH